MFFFAVWAGPAPPAKTARKKKQESAQTAKKHPKSPNNKKEQTKQKKTLLPSVAQVKGLSIWIHRPPPKQFMLNKGVGFRV